MVSLPCWELFEEQGQEYKDSVLPPSVTARVSVEAGTSFGWAKYIGLKVRSGVACHRRSGPVRRSQ